MRRSERREELRTTITDLFVFVASTDMVLKAVGVDVVVAANDFQLAFALNQDSFIGLGICEHLFTY